MLSRESDTVTPPQAPAGGHWLWLGGAFAFSLLFTARAMTPALQSCDVIQDDARQHVFWMLRFRDPDLFRDDLIADYFQSVAPAGYTALYWILSWVVDPRLASKVLPPILGCTLAVFVFLLTRRMHSSNAAAFLATVLASWYVWQYDDLASASPRAFLLPTLAAMLWALASERLTLAVAITLLAALLYPVGGVLGVALLGVRLVPLWCPGRRGSRAAPTSAFVVSAVLVGLALLPGLLLSSPFGPVVSAQQARAMPEFGQNGRNAFFVADGYRYWLESYRSGLDLRVTDAVLPRIPILLEYGMLAAILPLLLLVRDRLRGAAQLTSRTYLLAELLVASFALFLLAHALLFRLYLPARYVQWSVPLVLSVAGGLALGILVEEIAAHWRTRRCLVTGGLALLLAAGLALYPAHYDANFVRDNHPAVTAYLRAQPKDTLVAAAPIQADSVPALTGRRVLVAREYALAYHLGYYEPVRERIEELIDAYYADSPRRVAAFAARYGVDLLLVNRSAFRTTTFGEAWTTEFEPFVSSVSGKLARPTRWTLLELIDRCAVVDDGTVAVLPVECLGS